MSILLDFAIVFEHANASDMVHAGCCDDDAPTVAICGSPIRGESVDMSVPLGCVVCCDLAAERFCPRHGACRFEGLDA